MRVERDRLVPYLLVAPSIAYMAFFIGYPLVEGMRLAFVDE